MRPCPSDKALSRYLDGELSGAAAGRLREHLRGCPRCAERHERLRAVDEAVRADAGPPAEVPDLARRVTGDLGRRGAFLRARVAAGKRRLFGDGLRSWRMLAALSAAAGLVLIAMAGMDWVIRRQWVRQTEPVLADAERVLVRLVYVERGETGRRLAWARDQTRKLDLAQRLSSARSGAGPAWHRDLGPLETTFTLLARADPLPPRLVERLCGGELLGRTSRLRESLARGG